MWVPMVSSWKCYNYSTITLGSGRQALWGEVCNQFTGGTYFGDFPFFFAFISVIISVMAYLEHQRD